ncbi:DUF2235 domain-containing protein [Paraburkholderia sp. CNPSo 3274]|nr:DUF2235 domain-containing protein [Paraburkholderia sp. CNPSo 3274]MCP3711422.1 DUF2235 domain-containing protein [Paraburkholderia sp. CNPSo 3274]
MFGGTQSVFNYCWIVIWDTLNSRTDPNALESMRSPLMSKNIVLCLDGTWNGPNPQNRTGGLTPTNVEKLFENLKGSAPLGPNDNELEIAAPESAGEPAQVAKYIHGVGNGDNPLDKVAGGAVGLGLIARIVRGYTYLSRQYQPGDKIYIVGFSRGAYTARSLAGFVTNKGLLDWTTMGLSCGVGHGRSARDTDHSQRRRDARAAR